MFIYENLPVYNRDSLEIFREVVEGGVLKSGVLHYMICFSVNPSLPDQ
jgi:hypothetical protein